LQLSPRVSTRSIRRALDEATYLSIPVEKGLSTLNAAGIYREFALAEQFRHARTPAVPQTTNERLSRSPGPDISYFERIGFDRYNRFLTDISLP